MSRKQRESQESDSEPIDVMAQIEDDSEAPSTLSTQIEKTRVRQKSYVMDLRIHSPASLGYLGVDGLDTAPALVRLAKAKGLDVIAVTDFYSGKFVDRVAQAGRSALLTVIPGTVIRCALGSCDDVTLSCLFPEDADAEAIERFLAALRVPENARGDRRFRVPAPLPEILAQVERFNAVVFPSRMDKTPHRMAVIPQLVEEFGFRAFDLAYPDTARFFKARWPKIKFRLFSFSNANALAQVGSRIARVKMPVPGFAGIKQLVAREGLVANPGPSVNA